MADTQLLPCAHCGCEPVLEEYPAHSHSAALQAVVPGLPDHPGSWTIECPTTSCVALIGATLEEVASAWNRRAPRTNEPAVDAREKFEAWAIDGGFDVSRDSYGHYHAQSLEQRWDVWQAALAHQPAQERAESVSGLNLDHVQTMAALFADAVARLAVHDHNIATVLAKKFKAALAKPLAPTVPVAWRDALRRSGATDHHGRIAFLPAQLEQFVSMLTAHQPAQEQTEPVAWRYRNKGSKNWHTTDDRGVAVSLRGHGNVEVRPLFDSAVQQDPAASLTVPADALRQAVALLVNIEDSDEDDEPHVIAGKARLILEAAFANRPGPTVPASDALLPRELIERVADRLSKAQIFPLASELRTALAHQSAHDPAEPVKKEANHG